MVEATQSQYSLSILCQEQQSERERMHVGTLVCSHGVKYGEISA